MKVTVIGAGNMGSAFVHQLVKAGHQVSVTARDAAKAARVAAASPGANAVPSSGAARGADVVVLATGYADAVPALCAADVQPSQVVIDITNPLPADSMGLTQRKAIEKMEKRKSDRRDKALEALGIDHRRENQVARAREDAASRRKLADPTQLFITKFTPPAWFLGLLDDDFSQTALCSRQ